MGECIESSRYVNYFLVCGLDLNFGLEPDGSNSSLEQQINQEYNPLERAYKPRILQHYPDITQWSHFNPDALSRLCLPQGLKFCTQSEKGNFTPGCHPFILTLGFESVNFLFGSAVGFELVNELLAVILDV